ncbi:helix-turn-helix domain-containing protein [Streptomyces sp. NPDC049954]|uniref:TetR/AcrR family transcriptional regulator n=1 Tax=Streptomyces sp. NPDC049954 TaxID=3155779 RepID=UPI003428A090
MVRMSAGERRESAVRAAVVEFAERGYDGTSTESIARRVGVSQPYLFRLFKNKKALFLAAAQHCVGETQRVFQVAGEGLEGEVGEVAVAAMGRAYQELLAEQPEVVQMYLQIYGAAAAAKASGDEELAEALRRAWADLFDCVVELHGGDVGEATQFLAYGMLVNNLVALGFSREHRVWSGVYEEARAPEPDAEAGRRTAR